MLPDAGSIAHLGTFRGKAFRDAMNRFFAAGGYEADTPRDEALFAELDRVMLELLPPLDGRIVLDLACGVGRRTNLLGACRLLIAADVAELALRQARARIGDRSDLRLCVMDGHCLPLADGSIDVVTFMESLEHVHDLERVLGEVCRVVRPGGCIMLSSANRDSLHLRLMRALGFPEFKTSFQHVREYTLREVSEMLARFAMEVEETRGVFLYPYWGVPVIDDCVRQATDHDAELIETLRTLGRLAGAEFAYTFVLRARKRDARTRPG